MAVDRATQAADLPALYFEDLAIGQSASLICTVEETTELAGEEPNANGGQNTGRGNDWWKTLDSAGFHPERLRFGQYILHGAFTSGLVSRLIGTQLPGVGGVYLSQTFQYIAPVRVGDILTARVEIVELIPSRRRVRLFCECLRDGIPVLEGEAWLSVLARADEKDADAAR